MTKKPFLDPTFLSSYRAFQQSSWKTMFIVSIPSLPFCSTHFCQAFVHPLNMLLLRSPLTSMSVILYALLLQLSVDLTLCFSFSPS